MWPCLLSLIAIIYGMLSLRALIKRKIVVDEFIDCTDSDLKDDRYFYFRFMCFSGVELTIAFPLGLYILFNEVINQPVVPWISWEDTHSNFDRVGQVPAIYVTSNFKVMVAKSVSLWSVPFLSYIFFLFFGFGPQQVKQYKRWFYALLKPFGISPLAPVPNPHSTASGRTRWQKLLRRPASPSPLPCVTRLTQSPSPPFAVTSTSSSSIIIIGNPDPDLELDLDLEHLPRPPHPAYAMLNRNRNRIVDLNKARPILWPIR